MVTYWTIALSSVSLFAIGPALAFFRIVAPQTGLLLLVSGSLLGLVVTVAGLAAMLRGQGGVVVAVWFLGAVPCGFLVFAVAAGSRYPLINDISTEAVYPPGFEHVSTLPEAEKWDLAFPSDNGAKIAEAYPNIKTLALIESLDEVYGRAYQLAQAQPGWTILAQRLGEKEHAIEGYAESPLFHFRDYFVIRIREIEASAVVVDMRSKSRDGKGDFGANARRIYSFLEKLKA